MTEKEKGRHAMTQVIEICHLDSCSKVLRSPAMVREQSSAARWSRENFPHPRPA
jgi:hypothetical protein